MPIFECPKSVCNVFGIIPASIHLVAKVCLNMCIAIFRIPAFSHTLKSIVSYVLFLTGVPFLQTNTVSFHSKDIKGND